MKRAHHIPEDYLSSAIDGAVMWRCKSDVEPAASSAIAQIATQALASVPRLLGFQPQRAIHIVVYQSLDDSLLALGRSVSPTFLLAPLHTAEIAVLVLHSPHLDPRNGDEQRMLRHLCHEVTHVCAAERTGSVKRLGDGDVGMKLRPWVDEGFAECVSAQIAGRPDLVEWALAVENRDMVSMEMIDSELRALDSTKRAWAFQVATSRVWRAVQRRGFQFVFSHLDEPELWT